jgi:serine/threonine-protein kinase
MSQDPGPGQRTAGGTVIKVVISEGSDQVVVPDVSEMALPQAEMNLRAASLGIGKVREGYDEHVPRNYVRTTLPASGAKVVKGTRVHIELSLGPKPSVVPPPPPPPLPSLNPGQIGHRETIAYTVPQEGAERGATVTVTVEVEDDKGRRVIYDQALQPGEAIPPQTLQIATQTTVRILVEGVLQKQQTFQP